MLDACCVSSLNFRPRLEGLDRNCVHGRKQICHVSGVCLCGYLTLHLIASRWRLTALHALYASDF